MHCSSVVFKCYRYFLSISYLLRFLSCLGPDKQNSLLIKHFFKPLAFPWSFSESLAFLWTLGISKAGWTLTDRLFFLSLFLSPCSSLTGLWKTRKAGRSTWFSRRVRTSVRVRRVERSRWRGTDAGSTTSCTERKALTPTGKWSVWRNNVLHSLELRSTLPPCGPEQESPERQMSEGSYYLIYKKN